MDVPKGSLMVEFIYSEKATNVCEIFTLDLSCVVTVKSTVEISENFVAFIEYMNFDESQFFVQFLDYLFKNLPVCSTYGMHGKVSHVYGEVNTNNR